jgi:hypothetical protein
MFALDTFTIAGVVVAVSVALAACCAYPKCRLWHGRRVVNRYG